MVSLGCPRVLGVSFGCLVTELNVTQPKLGSSRLYLIHTTSLYFFLSSSFILYFTPPNLLIRFTANARSVFFFFV